MSLARARAARVLRRLAVGVVASLLVALASLLGLLDPADRFVHDRLARSLALAEATTSPQLAIVGIDDRSLATIGRWPWDREILAAAIDELTHAGSAVVALDLLLDDPQRPRYAPDPLGGPPRRLDDDAILAAAIRRHGRVVLAGSFPQPLSPETDLPRDPQSAEDNLNVTPPEPAGGPSAAAPPDLQTRAVRIPLARARDLLAHRPGLIDPAAEPAELLAAARTLLPEALGGATRGGAIDEALRTLDRARALALRQEHDSAAAPPAGAAPSAAPESPEPTPPLYALADAAAALGSATFGVYDADGILRRIPLWTEHAGRLWPSLSVAILQIHHDLTISRAEVGPRRTTIPGAGPHGPAQLATHLDRLGPRRVGTLHWIVWPAGEGDWRRQFADPADPDADRRAVQLSIGRVLEPWRLEQTARDNALALAAVVRAAEAEGLITPPSPVDPLARALRDAPVGSDAWSGALRELLTSAAAGSQEARAALDFFAQADPNDLGPDERAMIARLEQIAAAPAALEPPIRAALASADAIRAELRRLLQGRVCLVGWTATGAAADFVPTSIHPRTPGVYVHASAFNTMLGCTPAVSPVPRAASAAILLVLALVASAAGALLGVRAGALAVALLLGGWAIFSALVLYRELALVATTGALGVPALPFAAVMLERLVVEQRRRRRTEDRFKSYVSPAVVDILVDNPALVSMAPVRRELTVLFADLAGFTAAAERLGEQKTAEVLQRYLGAMTEILQSTGATLDKYLGDGIMAFWGAPIEDPYHARHACRAAERMLAELDRLNAAGVFGEAGPLSARIGIASGPLMVGDFGNPPRNSAYTVIGDAANLAARLESACKFFGTRSLIASRTRDLAMSADPGDHAEQADRALPLRFRAIGRVRVKGRTAGEPLFELLTGAPPTDAPPGAALPPHALRSADHAHPPQDALTPLREAFEAGRFDHARALADELARQPHDRELARAYRLAIQLWEDPDHPGNPRPGFDGTIPLTEK